MIYLEGGGVRLIILETENIEEIKKGRPAMTPDKQIAISWTPDPEWLVKKILEANGDLGAICAAIDESAARPQAPSRPPHQHRSHYFKEKKK